MPADRWRVFLDTNVLIAGLASRTGASAAILDLGESEEILITISRQVLVECDRVFLEKFPHLSESYRTFIKHLAPLLIDDPPPLAIREAGHVIHANDAPILAAAKHAHVDYLVSLNTKHFHTPNARAFLSIPILTPGEFLVTFRNYWIHPT